MAVYLSTGMLSELSKRLIDGGYREDTPAVIASRATWPDEGYFRCTVAKLAETAAEHGITKTALILVGDVIGGKDYEKSKLYDRSFATGFRPASTDGSSADKDGGQF
jgi:precorrin-4/cobalt-precorrin-4 C11-methyltransferase